MYSRFLQSHGTRGAGRASTDSDRKTGFCAVTATKQVAGASNMVVLGYGVSRSQPRPEHE